MKLYTIFTESHRKLYHDYFLKTLPNEFDLVALEVPQECPTGDYHKEGWNKTTYRKIELFEKACIENQGNLFAFSDVDIQFFGDIKKTMIEELGDYDIACQNNTGNNTRHKTREYYCAGFFICRANERTLNMFTNMKKNYGSDAGDQTTLNKHIHMVKSKFLSRKFFNICHLLHDVWSGQDFNINYEILMHHSNWVVGVDNKMKLLDIVRKKVEIQNGIREEV